MFFANLPISSQTAKFLPFDSTDYPEFGAFAKKSITFVCRNGDALLPVRNI
jgi:hypothetical protein